MKIARCLRVVDKYEQLYIEGPETDGFHNYRRYQADYWQQCIGGEWLLVNDCFGLEQTYRDYKFKERLTQHGT